MITSDFVTRHDLWSTAQHNASTEAIRRCDEADVRVVRLSFVDQHGVLRGKSITVGGLSDALRNGYRMTTTLLVKDTSHRTVYPVWQDGGGFDSAEMTGGGDFVMVPDPETFTILPWASSCGWLLCDIYFPNGTPVPYSTRAVCQRSLQRLATHGLEYVSGLEIEFHIFRVDAAHLQPHDATQPGTPPTFSLLTQGYQYLTESRLDELEPVYENLRVQLEAIGLPLRSMEVEFGPSQCEFTLQPQVGLATGDSAVLFRSAIKQICARAGLHATFMCRPQGQNLFASGWHLHQSLRGADGRNAFVPADESVLLSSLGEQFVAGILRHAAGACVMTTPTINGYKRYQPFTLAPDRIVAGADNRGAMLRITGSREDDSTRIENRIGDPAANPYLYIASQIESGLAGIEHGYTSAVLASTPYATEAAMLPRTLADALSELRDDEELRKRFGAGFIDYLLTLKQAEVDRFAAAVTDWEQREYFSLF